jgi:hypothetical protein
MYFVFSCGLEGQELSPSTQPADRYKLRQAYTPDVVPASPRTCLVDVLNERMRAVTPSASASPHPTSPQSSPPKVLSRRHNALTPLTKLLPSSSVGALLPASASNTSRYFFPVTTPGRPLAPPDLATDINPPTHSIGVQTDEPPPPPPPPPPVSPPPAPLPPTGMSTCLPPAVTLTTSSSHVALLAATFTFESNLQLHDIKFLCHDGKKLVFCAQIPVVLAIPEQILLTTSGAQ